MVTWWMNGFLCQRRRRISMGPSAALPLQDSVFLPNHPTCFQRLATRCLWSMNSTVARLLQSTGQFLPSFAAYFPARQHERTAVSNCAIMMSRLKEMVPLPSSAYHMTASFDELAASPPPCPPDCLSSPNPIMLHGKMAHRRQYARPIA